MEPDLRAPAEHPNATAYRRTADAVRAGDLAAAAELLDTDVVWHVPGGHPLARDYRGLEEVLAFQREIRALGFRPREHDVFGNDQHVCALSEMGASRPGRDVSTPVVSIFHYCDGRQLERWFYPEDRDAWDAIFTP